MLNLIVYKKALGWNWLFFLSFLLLFSCNKKSSNEAANGEESVQEVEQIEENDDDTFESASNPVAISGVNLTYENAKVICDYSKSVEGDYQVSCKVVDTTFNGSTYLPTQIEPGLSIEWQQPTIVKGTDFQPNCPISDNPLILECTIPSSSVLENTEIEIAIDLQKDDKKRQSKSKVQLNVSVNFTAGYVPSLPFSYSSTVKEIEGVEGLGLTGAESKLTLIGFSQRAQDLKNLILPPGSITSVCSYGERVFFASGNTVYLVLGDKFITYAGIGRVGAPEDLISRYSIHFGGMLKLACHTEGVYVADNIKNRILKLFDEGQNQQIAGKNGDQGRFGYSTDGTLATKAKLLPITFLAIHPKSNLLYFSELYNNSIRYIDAEGKIQTIIGSEKEPIEANTSAKLDDELTAKELLDFSALGMELIPRKQINKLIKFQIQVNAKTGIKRRFCEEGIGKDADGRIGTFCEDKRDSVVDHNKEIGRISSFSFDKEGNSILITNRLAHILQKVDIASGQVSLIAGTPMQRGNTEDGKLATETSIAKPQMAMWNSQNQIVFSSNTKLRKIDTDQKVSTLAGKLPDAIIERSGDLDFDIAEAEFYQRKFLKPVNGQAGNTELSYLQDFTFLDANTIIFHDTFQLLKLELRTGEITSLTGEFDFEETKEQCLVNQPKAKKVLGKITRIQAVQENQIYFLSDNQIFRLENPENPKLIRLTQCGEKDSVVASQDKVVDFVVRKDGGIYFFVLSDKQEQYQVSGIQAEGDLSELYYLPPGKTSADAELIDSAIHRGFYAEGKENFFDESVKSTEWVYFAGNSPILLEENRLVFSTKQWQLADLNGAKIYFLGFRIASYDLQTKEKTIVDSLDFMDRNKAIRSSLGTNPLHEAAATATDYNGIAIAPFGIGGVVVGNPLLHQIYTIDNKRVKTVIMGSGKPGSTGEGGKAIDATLNWPSHITAPDTNTILFLDHFHQNIRMLRRQNANSDWTVETMMATKSQNDCATSYESKPTGESAGDILSTSLSTICKGVVTAMGSFGNCVNDDKITVYYAQEFEKKYNNLVSVVFDCSK